MSDKGPDSLGERIARAKSAREDRIKRPSPGDGNVYSAGAHALRYGVEFAMSVVVGGFIGYWIDHYAGTAPWGLFIMGAFGLAAGVLSMVRAYRQLMAAAEKETEGSADPDEDGKTG